jgi:hypothetical protein
MGRVMEIFVIVNAACGIAAFVVAKGLINRAKRKITREDEQSDL